MSQVAVAEEHRPMTLADWASLPEDEPGELVDGRLVEEEVPDFSHEAVVAWVMRVLGTWIEPRGGWVFGSEAKFAVRRERGRKPDVSVFLPGTPKPPRHGVGRTPPDIMVEVVSPSPRDARRDRIEKLNEYAVFGVRFYWIIDPTVRSFELYALGDNGLYTRALSATDGVIVAVPGCEGLTLDLDALWARIDQLGPDEPAEE